MSAPPLVPSPLYGLRTWASVGATGEERLAGPQLGTTWPLGGAWLHAACSRGGHAAPDPECGCGIHAYHPAPGAARTLLRSRRTIPGVIEAAGATELHRDGFRAERARPRALLLAPGANAGLVERLGASYEVDVVRVRGPEDVVAWCRTLGLGLEPAVVTELLGPERLAREAAARARRVRRERARLAAVLAAVAICLGIGIAATDPPGDRPLFGRAGPINQEGSPR